MAVPSCVSRFAVVGIVPVLMVSSLAAPLVQKVARSLNRDYQVFVSLPARAWAQSVIEAPVTGGEAPQQPVAVTDAIIRQAVRATIAEDPQPAQGATALSGGVMQACLNAAFDQARVPDCLHSDALKHQPANIGPIAVLGR